MSLSEPVEPATTPLADTEDAGAAKTPLKYANNTKTNTILILILKKL